MNLKQGLFIVFSLFSISSFSQSDLYLKLEVNTWQYKHDYKNLSNPYSLAYTSGLNFEKVINKSLFAIYSGIDYTYSPKGVNYIDLTDKQDPFAIIFEEVLKERFIGIPHHEFKVPFMFIFYLNEIRTGIGVSYSKIFYGKQSFTNISNQYTDYGLNATIGARLSRFITFSMGYYYGLNNVVKITASEIEKVELHGKIQRLNFCLSFSIFNSIKEDRYYLSTIDK